MRIISSNIGMESARRYESSHSSKQTFLQMELREGEVEAEATKQEASKEDIIALQDRVDSMRTRGSLIRDKSTDTVEEFRQYMVKYIYELLFGRKNTDDWAENWSQEGTEVHANASEFTLVPMKKVVYSSETFFQEEESTSFSTQGIVKTADGREISINVDVTMSRSFTQYAKEELSIVQFQKVYDPLVINFGGNTAQLTDQKFFFDIDMDGIQDEVATLGSGSGYLAVDKNSNGTIDNGTELFGPRSGNGFSELSEFDEDGNGWIDEGDSIWNHLKIWCQNEDGTSTLYTLKDKNVGAICLQNNETQFSLKDAQNADLGYIRSSGIFLFENGKAGTVQHLDLVQ